MMAKRASGTTANIAILFGGLWCLTAHAAHAGKKISLDSAVSIANRAVAKTMVDGKFTPQRVEIAEESERHMTNRCLAETKAASLFLVWRNVLSSTAAPARCSV
jgi:hypothetical protein